MNIEDRLRELSEAIELVSEKQQETDRRLAQVLEAITRLTNIVEAHERGLDNLENQ